MKATNEQFQHITRNHPLVKHVLENDCKDPDCEVHHPDVALAEEVIGPSELAAFLAGAYTMFDLVYYADGDLNVALSELLDQLGF